MSSTPPSGETRRTKSTDREIGSPLAPISRPSGNVLLPLLNQLSPQQARAAERLATFMREGVQPPLGTIADAKTNPETVLGQALLSEDLYLGDPDVDDRVQRTLAALGLSQVSEET